MSHHVQLTRAAPAPVAPAPGEVPSVARRPYRWSVLSPSALMLALLTLPLPWVETSCGKWVERRTAAQLLVNRATTIDKATGVESSDFRGTVPVSMSLIWTWLFVVVAGAVLGFFARHLVPALLHLVLSCASVGTFVMLVVCLVLENLLSNLRFLPGMVLTLLACLAAAVTSILALAKQHGGRQDQNADP